MRHFNILMFVLLCLITMPVTAQENDLVNHNFGFALSAGESNLFLREKFAGGASLSTPKLGGGAGLGVLYELQYKHLLFRTGFGFDYTFNRFGYKAPDMTLGIKEYNSMLYHYQFNSYLEKTQLGMPYVPVYFGGLFRRMFFLVGAKIGVMPLVSTSQATNVTIWATDDDVIDPMHGLYTHEMRDYDFRSTPVSRTFNMVDVMAHAEVGINLDPRAWMDPKELQRILKREKVAQRRKNYRKPLSDRTHYRLSVFADYGFSNLHQYAPNPVGFRDGEEHYPDGGLVAIPDVTTVQPYTAYGFRPNEKAWLNNLFVGVKLAIMFELPHKHKKNNPTYPYITSLVTRADNGQPIYSAQVTFADTKNKKRKPVVRSTNRFGQAAKGFPESDYAISVKAGGFLPSDTIFMHHGDDEDTVRFVLTVAPTPVANTQQIDVPEPAPEPRTFILQNMHFATDKTVVLASSRKALEMLYQLLKEHPDVRIRIIGHTDDTASEEYNQKLSEGRANSVRNEMIKRGIDPKRMEIEGRGELDPLVPNDTDENRQMNRRVEIEILSGDLTISEVIL